MTKIILCGCNGKMGQVISRCIQQRDDCKIIAGIDITGKTLNDYPVYTSPSELDVAGDVLIDFSHPSVLAPLLEYAKKRKVPVVLSTTGYAPEQVEQIHQAAKEIPVFFSGNMSLGINLLTALAKTAARVLGSEFDIEIVEKHHNQKIDAPSGTALMLANAISGVMEQEPVYMYDRHSQRRKRTKNEIGIHSVRGGTIVGEHDVIFAGHDETITLSHCAQSKEVFAVGSVNAALFIAGKAPGLYDMTELVQSSGRPV